jgi:predicted SAM-dependent methyltransferase
LHLGCGNKNWDGWLNVDLFGNPDIEADLRRLPFKTDYAESAIAVHVIEHFYLWDVPELLLEWKRVLKPGGKLILELPCMDKIVKYMADCVNEKRDMDVRMTWLAMWGDPDYRSVEMCHKWGYTKLQIVEMLKSAGFTGIQIEEPVYHVRARDMRVVAYKGDEL